MNFLEEIKKIENERKENEEKVINEIVEHFKEKFNSDNYKVYLKERIIKEINNGKKELELNIEFWEYHCGCSATNFICGGRTFKLESGEYDFKGIRLQDIQHKVCDKLSGLLKDKLKELGLIIISNTRHDNEYRFKYHKEKIVVSW